MKRIFGKNFFDEQAKKFDEQTKKNGLYHELTKETIGQITHLIELKRLFDIENLMMVLKKIEGFGYAGDNEKVYIFPNEEKGSVSVIKKDDCMDGIQFLSLLHMSDLSPETLLKILLKFGDGSICYDQIESKWLAYDGVCNRQILLIKY